MEVERLLSAGTLLFGARWQAQMAEAIGVDERTIRKWLSAARIPDYVAHDVKRLLVRREAEIREERRKFPRARRSA